jgi:hypothetical protein
MPNKADYDFGGYATKNDLKCSDGRTIRRDAFIEQDGMTVPLVYGHLHNDIEHVLGHALLENREDGMYAYGKFNDTVNGKNAKLLVQHGDITMLSIFANGLVEKSKNVLHGAIREVSLVLAGANPGAKIDNMVIAHEDGSQIELEDEAIIYTGVPIKMEVAEVAEPEVVTHADAAAASTSDKTVAEVFDGLTDEEKTVVYAMIAEAIDASVNSDATVAQSDIAHSNEGETVMKNNVFDSAADNSAEEKNTLSHAQMNEIFTHAIRYGSLKESFLKHVGEYGFDHPEYLFPDARTVTGQPAMIQRRMEWVAGVLSGTYHTPFSRIKSITADITADEARAKGYVKAAKKTEEVIKLLRRTTGPTTIYKKAKLDRDDITDITDFDVVVWQKSEMRVMLDEEVARAILISDGRAAESADKINEDNIRPIYSDDDMYVVRTELADDETAEDCIEAVLRARENYEGSGSPTMYTTTGFLNDMLLLKDNNNRRMYATQVELETALRVKAIVEVPVMNGVHRDITGVDARTLNLRAIVVNLKDYTVGADKGGQVSLFEDFDIDYNQQKFLIETRISGALTMPKSAIVIEQVAPAG